MFGRPTLRYIPIDGEVTSVGNGKNLDIRVHIKCTECKKNKTHDVNTDDLIQFMNSSVKVQDAFPYLPKEDREMFLSGLCSECWDTIMKDEEQE